MTSSPLRLQELKFGLCSWNREERYKQGSHHHWLLESFRSLYTYLGKSYCFFRAFKSTQRVLEALCLACLLGITYEYDYVNISSLLSDVNDLFHLQMLRRKASLMPTIQPSRRWEWSGTLMVIVVSPLLGGSGKGVYPRLVSSTIG